MKQTIFFSAIILLFIFSGCKKYDEGPKLITLRTVKSRLTNGDWQLKELITGGLNSTDSYKEIKFYLSFTKFSGEYNCTLKYTYLGELVEASGNVGFLNKGDDMQMQLYTNGSYSTSYYPSFFTQDSNYEYPIWSISKLTNNELWMETVVDGIATSIKLTKDK